MPDYTLTDTVTGETISVTGDSPPTPQDAEELFQAYYERERTAAGQALETAKGVGRGFANAFLSAGEGLAELADAGTNAIGLEDLIDSGEENDLVRAAREGRAAIEESMGADAAYRDQWLTKFGEGVGSFASFFTPTAAVRLAGLAGKGIQASRAVQAAELGAAGTLAAGTGAGDQAQRIQAARDAGLDVSEGQEDAAIVGGTMVGLSELATPVRLLRRLRGLEAGDQLPSGISQRLRSALMSGTVEGVQEVTASLLQDAVEKGVYNEALEIGGGNLMDDFTVGGAIGAGADLVLNAVAGRRNKDAFKSSEEAERKKREDLEDAQNQRQANLPKDLAEQARIDAQSNLDVKAAAEARRQAAGAEVDPAQIAPPTGRALTTKLKTPARIVNISDASGQTFQAEEKTRIRNKGKPTEQVTTFVEVPGGGEVITSVNGVPQQTGLQITTVAEPTAGIQRRYPKQPMLAYAQQIRQTMGDSFPSADNSFTVNLPQEFGGALGDTTQLDETGGPVFTVQDSSGQQFGIPLNNSEDAFALAGFLNDEIINDNVFSAGDAVISTSPEAYDTDQASTLQAYNFAVNHPDSNTYTSVAVDSAAETTQDRGFDEVADVKTLVENRVGPSKMTASQRINAKRLRKGLPVTNNFTIEEVRSVLKEDQLYNLTDTRVNGLPETETYNADLSKAGNPIIRSSAGEVLQGRPLTVLEKDAEIKANPKKKPPKLVKFKTEADARVYANQLNNATGKAAVEKGVMRNVDGNFQEMQSLLEAKNITSKVGSPEVKYLASRILGKKTIKSINDLSVAEARLLYQRLRSLPRFDKPTKLPTFKLPKYTGAQFRAAVQTLQENPNAGELALADATGINIATKSGAESMQELRKDIAKQGVKPVAPVETVVEQQQETLALPAPSVDVDRLRSAIKKVMTGFGLKDVGLSLDYALRTAVKDPLGNLVYGIRPRQGGDIDADVIGGEAALAREAKYQLVRSDQADPEDRAEAYYDPRINTIFLSIDKAMQGKTLTDAQVEAELLALLDHEMIHAMRKLDLFTNKEWNLLSRAASKKIHPTKDRDGNPQTFLKWAQNNYNDLSPVDQVEESVAELVRRAREDSKLLQGKPRSLVERIARFFRNMVSALRGEQFNTFSEVIGGIGSGTIGGRQRGEIRTFAQTEKAASRTLAKPPPGTVITTGEEAERDAAMQGQSVPDFSRRAVGAPQTEVRPEVADAYSKLQSGEFTRQQYDSVVLGTIEPYDFVPEPATTEEMFEALAVQSQKDKINAEVPDGSRVGLRLDINAYKNFGTWVPTIHDQKGKSISHMATASIKNADFTMLRERAGRDPKNLQEDARSVMEGKNKFPFAQIMGDFVNRDPEQTASLAEEFINSPDWVQVGFDPRRHSYFYDRKTGEPVTFAEEVIQVGPLVLAKNATKNVLPSGEQFETLFSRRAPTEAEMGINVRTDGDTNYAELIVSGQKKYETRDKDSLRPYVGKRIGIVETGSGPAKLVGYATVGEPIEVGEVEFADSRDQHLVPEGSKFDIKSGQSKFLYEMIDPEQLAQPIDASGTKGIVARNISNLGGDNVRPQRGRDGRGRDQARSVAPTEDQGASRTPLEGAPIRAGATGPDPAINAAAERYAETYGIPLARQSEYVRVDPERATRIAQAYEEMADDPTDPNVRDAYEDLARQTRNQYDALIDEGFEFDFYDSDTDPYDGNPYNAMRDLRSNKRMSVYGTYDGYGTLDDFYNDIGDPNRVMLRDTGLRWKDQLGREQIVTNNDLFRAVHDAFGHGIEGAGFRARGEENAWQAHAKLFTGPALQALTSETRGQNSWLNYGPYGEQNQGAGVLDTVFADQKMGLMPEWTSREGRDGFEESPMFSRRAAEQGGIEGNVSTRYPTAARSKEDPLEDLLVNDYETFLADGKVFGKNMELIKDANLYPILQKSKDLRSDKQKAEAFVELVKNNLLNIYDRVPADTRNNSKVWYKGANALVRRFAERHNLTMQQAAAVAANLSPQKDWYQNASLAERTIDTFFDHAGQPFTPEMKARAEEIFFHDGISAKGQARNREMLNLIGSSSLDQVLDKFNEPGQGEQLGAMWIRTFDQTYNDPSYRIVSPDGRLLDYAKNSDGSNSKVAWGSLTEIAKSIKALRETDIDTISASLGSANKVRNFYNNIFDPDSDLGYVTIDTHAVAAGLLKPLGGSAFEVSHNFGTKGSSSSITGLNGVYSIYEEAYRRAAKERGVLPREMQSITWEAVRGLFRPEYKSQNSNVEVVDNIWKQYNKKQITLDQAREAIYEHAGQIKPPDWERSDGGIPEGDQAATYERKLSDGGVPRPRPDSASRRRGRGDAAREVQTEDVGLPFNLLDKYKRREVIGQSEVDRVVADNLQIAENRPAGTVPRFNPGADRYAQAVAADPDKGQELSDSEMPAFSRSNAPEINPAAQAAIDNVVADLPTNTPGQTYLNVLDQGPIAKWLTKAKQAAVNRYAQLENYQGMLGNLLADSSSLAAALMADRSNAITAAALQYGVPVYTGGMTKIADFNHTNSRGETKKIRGLIDLMSMLYTKEHGSLEQMAQAYSIAKRSERLRAKGIAVPGTPADHAANIATAESFLDENGNSIIKDWYDAWQDYNGYTVQFLKDTGVVDAETAEMWQDQSDYVPFYRQVEGADTPNAPNIFGGLTASADLKAIKGSEKEVNVPLLEAISMNLNAAISMGMKNVAQQRIVRDMRNIGLAREVKPGQNTTGEAVVTFKVNGNRRKFIVDDPLIYESLTVEPAGGVEREVSKILGFPSRFLREMVTREPGFVIANMLRDSLSAFVTSGSSFVPIADTIAGYAEGMEKLERTGVVGGYDYKNDPENIGEYAGKILQKRNKNVDQRGLLSKFFIGGWDLLGQATTRSDAATRNAVYNDVLARTGNEAEASYQAMEVLNFGRRGSSPVMRLVTATIPFLNARIQGLDVLARAGTGKSSANRDLSRSQAAMSFIARGSLIAASTAIYYTMVSDDEQYKEQTEEIKDNYWLIPTPSGVPVRIPIPFEVGLIFKTLPERIIDSYNEGTTAREAQQSIGRAVFGTLGVQPPQAVTPIMEAYMNYDLYTGRPVTPVFIDSSLPPELQELASTTEVAKNMAKVLGISPIKLDHLMKGYGGTIGSYILGMADYGLRDSFLQGDNRAVLAGTDVSQYPIIRRFFASEFGGGNKEDFYEMWDYIKRTENAAKLLQDQGRFDELESFLVNKKQFIGLRKQLQPTASALADLRKQRRTLLKSDLTADQKQEQMRFINTQEQYYLSIVPQLERYIELPTATETIANRISNLF